MKRDADIRYCTYCANPLGDDRSGTDHFGSAPCPACKRMVYAGPQVLVLVTPFAEDRILLMKRGLPPYVGTWAPPGGYVEAGESIEGAAIRETREEVGIELHSEQLLPNAFISLPELNQVYLCFLAILDRMVIPTPAPPESLDARWFALEEFPRTSMWGPGAKIDIASLFKQAKTGRIEFRQRTGDVTRVIGSYDVRK